MNFLKNLDNRTDDSLKQQQQSTNLIVNNTTTQTQTQTEAKTTSLVDSHISGEEAVDESGRTTTTMNNKSKLGQGSL